MTIGHIRAEEGANPDEPMKLVVAGPLAALTPLKEFLKKEYKISTCIRKRKNEYVILGDVPQVYAKEITKILYDVYV